MNILVLGGTRFTGRAVAARLLRAGHRVTVSSRRPSQAPSGVAVLEGERATVLAALAGRRGFELVLDFTAYDALAVAHALAALPGAAYLLISSTWLTRLVPGTAVDAPVSRHAMPPAGMPEVTQRYLQGKAGAEEVVLSARGQGRTAAVLRLPILGGADDHTGRIDFYRRRVCDGQPVILVNGGENRANLLWCEDAADGLSRALEAGRLFEHAILDGIPDAGHPVREVLELIAKAEGLPLLAHPAANGDLREQLPGYLEQEPLWLEQAVAAGAGNLFTLSGHRPRPLGEWLAAVVAQQPPRVEQDGLRVRERALRTAEAVA